MANITACLAFLSLALCASASFKKNSLPIATKAECTASIDERLDCYPQGTQEQCEEVGCCWNKAKLPLPGVPSCFYPENYGGYETTSVEKTSTGYLAYMKRTKPSQYPKDVETLRVDIEKFDVSTIRVRITDNNGPRFEPPYPSIERPDVPEVVDDYNVEFSDSRPGFQISRYDGQALFDSLNTEGFIYSDQFIQITTLISGRLYGLGEHRTNLTLEPGWKRYTLFNYGGYPEENINEYGSHPFYLEVREGGVSHGVFLHNSNAMDVLLTPRPSLTFRTIGGILDFYIFLGPTPADVVRQYTKLIGRTFMPPFWSLGFHLCKYGYDTLDNLKATWKRNRDLKIHYDVQWFDIDALDKQNDFTYDPIDFAGFPDFIDEVHSTGMKIVPIVDAGVSAGEPAGDYPPYDLGVEMDIFVKDINGEIFVGKVWNTNSTVFPDYTHPRVQEYWNKMVSDYHDLVKLDGIWIDMNEPSNFYNGLPEGCPDHEFEHPPYLPSVVGDNLATSTLCMTAQQAAGAHYNVHNLFSISQANVTNHALRSLGKRPFVLSRSTFSGSGKYTGHWSGDTDASYYDMTKSIQELLTMNMYGVSLMGADICGFRHNTNPELCSRWFQLGVFYTFMRNHNDLGWNDQDPAVFDNVTIASIRKSLALRYSLLPYLYTLFYHSHTKGDTIARPLFFEFPKDPQSYEVDTAFMWGSGIYIIPVLQEGVVEVDAYCPEGAWYEYETLQLINCNDNNLHLDAPYDKINLLFRGGNVIPFQSTVGVTTTETRNNSLTLIVAPDALGHALGDLYWDDGDVMDPVENNAYSYVRFNLTSDRFAITPEVWNTDDVPHVFGIFLLNFRQFHAGETAFFVNYKPVEYIEHPDNRIMIVNLDLPMSSEIIVSWAMV